MKAFSLTSIATAMLTLTSANALAGAYIGEQLQGQLPSLAAADSVMTVVTFDQLEPLSTQQLLDIKALGISQGVQFKSLPVIGLISTKVQIEALSEMPGVRSIFANRQMEFFNSDARQITGVADVQGTDFEARNGIEFTGKNSSILIIDSGIDASHQDVFFGDTVVENIQALTHASAISITGITDGFTLASQVNTDLNSGHGTHVAGTISGSGVMSQGKYVGAAPDADLIGYGSGGGVLLLDTLGGFDYAINNVYSFEKPIKIISNSWGSSGKYEPLGPVSVATYKAHKLGIISVFAAGNSGSGEDTHNPYAQIPWGISVGAGEKDGTLADFSSRGLKGESSEFTMPDGSLWTYTNDITIVAPGVDIISTRALTNAAANGGDADVDAIETENLPFYTMISGTSMATPHVSGIIALMLEANPNLSNADIKRLLQETATNMPGYEKWEVGAGYVNARSAVAAALNEDARHKTTVNNLDAKRFNANAKLAASDKVESFEVLYVPVGDPDIQYFDVDENAVLVKASASSLANLTKLVLVAPDGTEYFGNLSTPVLEENMRVSAPASIGRWGVYAYGLTSLSGVDADPLDITNGPGLPEQFDVTVSFEESNGFDGMDDVAGHPQQNAIEFAVGERLMDGLGRKRFSPDNDLRRKDFARYAVMGGGVRQYRDLLNDTKVEFDDVGAMDKAYIESAAATGSALKDSLRTQNPVLRTDSGNADPFGKVTKLDMAYSLVQMLGKQDEALAFDPNSDIVMQYRGEDIVLADQNDIPADMKGYVQVALDYSLLNVTFGVEQGPFSITPELTATFNDSLVITRAHYAEITSRFFTQYFE